MMDDYPMLAICENELVTDDLEYTPCPGVVSFELWMNSAACPVCGAWTGAGVAEFPNVIFAR